MRRLCSIATVFVFAWTGIAPAMACTVISTNGTSQGNGPCTGCAGYVSVSTSCRCKLSENTCNDGGELKRCFDEDRGWSAGGGCTVYECDDYCWEHYDCRLPDATWGPCNEIYGQCTSDIEYYGGWEVKYTSICL